MLTQRTVRVPTTQWLSRHMVWGPDILAFCPIELGGTPPEEVRPCWVPVRQCGTLELKHTHPLAHMVGLLAWAGVGRGGAESGLHPHCVAETVR